VNVSNAVSLWRLSIALLTSLVAGCGGPSGPERVEVYGQVTYDGQPIPAGQVIFEPDPERGNTGPQGRGEINNGSYRTSRGKGSVPGPVIVRVEAYDGNVHPESPRGVAMLPTYVTKLDLPRAGSEQNIDIPSSHAKPR